MEVLMTGSNLLMIDSMTMALWETDLKTVWYNYVTSTNVRPKDNYLEEMKGTIILMTVNVKWILNNGDLTSLQMDSIACVMDINRKDIR